MSGWSSTSHVRCLSGNLLTSSACFYFPQVPFRDIVIKRDFKIIQKQQMVMAVLPFSSHPREISALYCCSYRLASSAGNDAAVFSQKIHFFQRRNGLLLHRMINSGVLRAEVPDIILFPVYCDGCGIGRHHFPV